MPAVQLLSFKSTRGNNISLFLRVLKTLILLDIGEGCDRTDDGILINRPIQWVGILGTTLN